MQLENQFRVSVPPDVAWRWFRDVEKLAPCLPGAQLQEIAGDEYRGVVKVKVGPIVAQYQGTARFESVDEASRVLVLAAQAREVKGQGNAKGTARVTLAAAGGGTEVRVETQVDLTGKVAQFGRGVITDVSAKLIAQFVEALEAKLATEASAPPAAPAEAAAEVSSQPRGDAERSFASGANRPAATEEVAAPAQAEPEAASQPPPRLIRAPEAEPIDLVDLGGGAFLQRHGVTLAVAVAAIVILWVLW